MNKSIAVRTIIGQSLRNIRGSKQLVDTALKLNPYMIHYAQLQKTKNLLNEFEGLASKLILAHKIAPDLSPVWNLPPLLVITGNQVLGADSQLGEQMLFVKLSKSEQWANDCIRELNQLQTEQKQLRQLLISYRNCLEELTAEKIINGGTTQKILEFIL